MSIYFGICQYLGVSLFSAQQYFEKLMSQFTVPSFGLLSLSYIHHDTEQGQWLWRQPLTGAGTSCLPFFTPFIVGDIDFRYGYIFASCLFVCVAVVYFFVIEGQGRTLEEIDTMYLMKVVPWKSSGWVAPPPEELVTTNDLLTGNNANGANLEQTPSDLSATSKRS